MKAAAAIMIVLPFIGTGCTDSGADEPSMPRITFEGVDADRNRPTTTQTIDEFKATAYYWQQYNFVTLMDGVTVKRSGINKWSYSPAVDWPGVPVNFLAVSPATASIYTNYWNNDNKIINYVCSGKEDLLVATRYDAIQGEGNIRLNFRHTLSQVTVRLRVDDSSDGMKVMLHKAYIKDIAIQGDYKLPTTTTSPIEGSGDNAVKGEWSTWNNNSTSRLIYDAGPDDTPLDATPLALDNQDVLFFIPAKLDPVQFSGYYHGSRIEVLYRVYDSATGKALWPSTRTPAEDIDRDEHHYAVARFALIDGVEGGKWRQGWSYNYTASLIPGNVAASGSRAGATLTMECDAVNP